MRCSLQAALLALLLTAVPALQAEPAAVEYPQVPLSDAQESHYRELLFTLRCLVCQNESLLDSDAPLAADLRQQVRSRIAQGESDSEIKKYLTDRYGDFVLYKPPMQANTLLLWIGPFVLALIGLVTAIFYARRTRRHAVSVAVDEEAVKRLIEDNR